MGEKYGGQYDDISTTIKVDALGNVLTTGYYSYVADFDPGPLTYTLGVSVTNSGGIFVSKLDAAGNFVWAKAVANNSNSNLGLGIDVDASGNVYTTGYFFNTLDFDPSPSTYTLTSFGSYDIYVSKLDVLGNFVWAKQMGGTAGDQGNGIAVDGTGNVYTTGGYEATADFDPGVGTYTFNVATNGTFVSKLDALGNFVWAKKFTGGNDAGSCIALDAYKNIYISGSFIFPMYLNSSSGLITLTSSGSQDVFVLRIDSLGNLINGKSFGSSTGDYGNAIAVDASNNVYTTGSFQSTVDFDPDATTYTLSASFVDAFISKISILNTTNIHSFSKNNSIFNIYPNPTTGEFNIDIKSKTNLIITNILGKIVLSENKEIGNHTINITNLSNGVYFVNAINNKQQQTFKLVKE